MKTRDGAIGLDILRLILLLARLRRRTALNGYPATYLFNPETKRSITPFIQKAYFTLETIAGITKKWYVHDAPPTFHEFFFSLHSVLTLPYR
jgi:hypothetical protein